MLGMSLDPHFAWELAKSYRQERIKAAQTDRLVKLLRGDRLNWREHLLVRFCEYSISFGTKLKARYKVNDDQTYAPVPR